jgi:hypothetical protein
MHDSCITLWIDLNVYFESLWISYLVLKSLLYWLNSILHIFRDYVNDCYTMVLIDIWSRGLDRPCLGKTNCTTPCNFGRQFIPTEDEYFSIDCVYPIKDIANPYLGKMGHTAS